MNLLRVALPLPLRRSFDYLALHDAPLPPIGSRVSLRFGKTPMIGIVIEHPKDSTIPIERLKPIQSALDEHALLPPDLFAILEWTARYYHHPIGDVFALGLPPALRQGQNAQRGPRGWILTEAGVLHFATKPKRAPLQTRIAAQLSSEHPRSEDQLAETLTDAGDWRAALRRMRDADMVEAVELDCLSNEAVTPDPPHALNNEQAGALHAIRAARGFKAFLLDGITGSGKTEVYLHAISDVLTQGKQVLVLIPEIGLTPQTVQRFRARFHQDSIALYHSGLSDGERSCTWQAAREGRARIVIGTRSSIFLAFADLGLVIVDEEHDASYKQQEGLRYHARDLAVLRAQSAQCPIVLGSATPSLESMQNANEARYQALHLRERAGGANLPAFRLLDIRQQRMQAGLSEPLLQEIRRQLDQGGQVLLFLNRRGYAPTLTCHTCGWVAQCPRCDAQMTVHRQAHDLACHHCGTRVALHTRCPDCGSAELRDFGVGTEKLEQAIAERFPGVATIRIDRDSTRNKGQIEALLNEAESGRARILIGTQMLAKGHHFPNVSLVAIIHADGGLFGADFRATEHLAQLLIQVAGRAGRAERPGQVWIQTHHPDHPLLQTLVREGYAAFATLALEERSLAGLPPFSHFALVRTESTQAETGMQFLQHALQAADQLEAAEGVQFLGPVPAPMERRAGRWRAQLLLQAQSRGALHRLLEAWIGSLENLPAARKVRWSLDVDPMDLF